MCERTPSPLHAAEAMVKHPTTHLVDQRLRAICVWVAGIAPLAHKHPITILISALHFVVLITLEDRTAFTVVADALGPERSNLDDPICSVVLVIEDNPTTTYASAQCRTTQTKANKMKATSDSAGSAGGSGGVHAQTPIRQTQP